MSAPFNRAHMLFKRKVQHFSDNYKYLGKV